MPNVPPEQNNIPPSAPQLSHLDSKTGTAQMVDVSAKAETARAARAVCFVRLSLATVRLIADKTVPKGDVLTVARVAGILAAKRTGELIPLCHPLPLTNVQIDLELQENGINISALASCIGRTGVEMEALTAAMVAALTIYDMCKSADKHIVIERAFLQEKTGGKSGPFLWDGTTVEENVAEDGG